MAGIAAVGTLSYNGYSFGGASTVTVRVEFVKDDAERTVIYHKHVITVRAIIAENAATDVTLLSIRAALSKQGQELKFINRGFGTDLWINRAGGGGLRDVKWGPIPEELSWTSEGSARAGEIVWQVTTCIPVCDTNGTHATTGLLAFNYDCSFDISAKGFTTRRITGYLEIAQTRNNRAVPDCADNYRHLIKPTPPAGFTREQSYPVSADKSRLDFTITDTEIESKNPWPAGVVEIKAKHTVNWRRSGKSAMSLRSTLHADIELAKGRPWSEAWMIFGNLITQRINASIAAGRPVLLDDIQVEEDIFGFGSSFTVSYRTIEQPLANDTIQMPNVLSTGIWKPVGTNWNLWRTSMANIQGIRGHAKLALLPGNDAIVDICGGQATMLNSPQSSQPPPPDTQKPWFKNKVPPPDKSYLQYDLAIIAESDRGNVVQRTMQEPDQSLFNDNADKTTNQYGAEGGTNDVLQKSGRASWRVSLLLNALRAGHQIPRPLLQQAGAQPATEMDSQFMQKQEANWFGVPIFRSVGYVTYTLPNAPGTLPVPGNPEQGLSAK